MNVLIANFGNASLAMIQWAIEVQLDNFSVLSVNTGWQSGLWQQHLDKVWAYLDNNGIQYHHLKSQKNFAECVLDRGSFPSKKFQWCPSFLKGLPILDWLDEHDMNAEAIIHLAKMRTSSRINQTLVSGMANEHYDDRIIEYPLLDFSIEERDKLIKNAGFEIQSTNSQECMPCIHATQSDWQAMMPADLEKIRALESQLGNPMFDGVLPQHLGSLSHYDMGCGNVWSCGE